MICALCRRKIGKQADVYLVDDEWLRRCSAMIGHIVCNPCSLEDQWGLCDADGRMPVGHIEPPRQRSICDSWTHLHYPATQKGAIMIDPSSAVRQGARDQVEALLSRPKISPQIRLAARRALEES